jgi:hypothetical protein
LPNAGKDVAVACVATEVTAPAPLRTRLQVSVAHGVRVWLNGVAVYHGRPANEPAAPEPAAVEVQLREGKNQLLFQVTYRGAAATLYARLLDPQRRLTYPEPH